MNVDSIDIRPTQMVDLASLVECLNPVFLERRYLAITEAIPVGEVMNYHASHIAAGHPHFVAMDGERVVGLCDVVPAALPRIAALAHVATIGMLLASDYRGHGLGERLLRTTLAACKGRWERIELNVYSHNERAHKLYVRCGFIEDGRRVGAWKLDGVSSDIIEMSIRM